MTDTIESLRAERDAALAEAAQLREALDEAKGAIDRDRTGLAAALNEISAHVKGFGWLLDGRGAYEWDDDRYRDEAGHAMRPVPEIAKKALAASGALADKAFRRADAALAKPSPAAQWLADEMKAERNAADRHWMTLLESFPIGGESHPSDPHANALDERDAKVRAAALEPLAVAMEAVKTRGWTWTKDRYTDLGERVWDLAAALAKETK